jgi:hypothetical protein
MDILTVARDEYSQQLADIMCPHMIAVYQEMYDKAVEMSKGKQVLKKYQELLRDVKDWNQNMVKGHCDTINNACSWYNDLLAAVFVSNIKILASVRLSAEKKKINVKIPQSEVFIQGCYENAARDLFKDPFIFQEEQNEYDRDMKLMERFKAAIYMTVKNMVPIQEILKTNIGDRGDQEHATFDAGGTLDEEEEDEPLDEVEPLEETPEEPMDPTPTPTPEVGGAPEASPEDEDVREIPVSSGDIRVAEDEDDEDDEDLAPGAPPK